VTAGPLAGVRVVELAGIGPGPYACLLLAEMGAYVVRVDRPGGAGLDAAPTPTLNRSRPTVEADLKDAAGVETVLRLAAAADVLVEGMRPGWPSASASDLSSVAPATPLKSMPG